MIIDWDAFDDAVDTAYLEIVEEGKGRSSIDTQMRSVFKEVLIELQHRVSDIHYDHPTSMTDDLLKDIEQENYNLDL